MRRNRLLSAPAWRVPIGKKIIYNKVLQCVTKRHLPRELMRLLSRAKSLFRMKKRLIDNVVIGYQTPVKNRSCQHGVTQT